MSRTIRIDEDVYAWLQSQARPFDDTPNSVLRRVAGIDQPEETKELPVASHPPDSTSHHLTESPSKFGKAERKKVVEGLETALNIRLSSRSGFRTVFEDEDGAIYWVIGGYGNWHGASDQMITETIGAKKKGKLFVAKANQEYATIYAAPLDDFLNVLDGFSCDKHGARKFNLAWKGEVAFIKEAPMIPVSYIGEVELRDS